MKLLQERFRFAELWDTFRIERLELFVKKPSIRHSGGNVSGKEKRYSKE